MDTQRCPMCGKENPPELEYCQYCQARLTPQQSAGGAAAEANSSGWPEWMRSSYDDNAQSAWDEDEEAAEGDDFPAQDLPDWLTAPAGESQQAPHDELQSTPGNGEDEPEQPQAEPESTEAETLFALGDAGAEAAGSDQPEMDFPETVEVDITAEGGEATGQPDRPEEANQPEWLQRVRARQQADEETQVQSEETTSVFLPPDETQKLPDWLDNLKQIDEPAAGDEPAQSEMPDWLAGSLQPGPSTEARPSETEPASGPVPGEIPAWMSEFLPSGMEDQESASQPPEGEAESLPSGEEGGPPEGDQQPEAGSLFAENLPEWLQQAPVEEAGEPQETGPEEPQELAAGELPSWLSAMRPVETLAAQPLPEEENARVESSGPLSGLRGVLAAEPDILQAQKPPVYTSMLQVSDANTTMAALLQEMVAAEGQPRPLPRRVVHKSQAILRVAAALVLFIAILAPFFTSSLQSNVPDYRPETGDVIPIVESLGQGSPVLVAVDYEPGFSGEMDAAAAGVIDHLMVKGAYLAFASTSPTGPAQAERLVQRVNHFSDHPYNNQSQYANLGFIPGGASGLLGLAESPRHALPKALPAPSQATGSRADVWLTSPLRGINRISDFSMVLVLTENADTARLWIEQVQRGLGDTPLVMVVSAQAEPLVLPYYLSSPQQVQGVVAGLTGGAAYESLTGREVLATGFWSPFGLGMLAALVMLLVGAVVNFLDSPMNTPGQRSQAQEDVSP